VNRKAIIRKSFVVAASVAWILLFMGDFCEDILGVPIYFTNSEEFDLEIDASSLGALPAPQPPPGDIDVDLDGIDIPEDLEDFEIPADLDIDVDLEQIFANLPSCATVQPSQTNPGENCLCDDNGNIFIAEGCVLGASHVDVAGSSSDVSEIQEYITGIYIRKLQYIVQAKELGIDLPGLDIRVRKEKKEKTTGYTPTGDWVDLGSSDAISSGVLNTWLFGWNPNADSITDEELTPEAIKNAIALCDDDHPCYCSSCTDETAACAAQCVSGCASPGAQKFLCAEPNRLNLNMSTIDDVSDVFQSLMFEIQVSFSSRQPIGNQIEALLTNPKMKVQMRLMLEMVVVAVPPT